MTAKVLQSLSHTHIQHSPSATVTLSRECRFIVSHKHTRSVSDANAHFLSATERESERVHASARVALRSPTTLSHSRHTDTRKQKKTRFFVKMRKKTKMRTTKSNPKRNHSYIFSYIHIVKYKNKRKGKQ